jgi:hypothetical protein
VALTPIEVKALAVVQHRTVIPPQMLPTPFTLFDHLVSKQVMIGADRDP